MNTRGIIGEKAEIFSEIREHPAKQRYLAGLLWLRIFNATLSIVIYYCFYAFRLWV